LFVGSSIHPALRFAASFVKMSQAKEVRYTARSITPPADRNGASSSPPPKRRSPSRSPPPKSTSRSPRPRSPKRRSSSRSQDDRNPGNNLYVTGLSTRVTEDELEKFFSKEGKVKHCHVVLDPRSKESRGFAFVTMDTVEDARRCIKYLHRTVLEGRLVTVEKAKRTRERTPTPGKYCGRRVAKSAMFYLLIPKEDFVFLNILSLRLIVYLFKRTSKEPITIPFSQKGAIPLKGPQKGAVSLKGSKGTVSLKGTPKGKVSVKGSKGTVSLKGPTKGALTLKGSQEGEFTIKGPPGQLAA
ncbi:Serine/arginine-rich splicing factor SR45a, partial [Dichanthelium oligosanthes]